MGINNDLSEGVVIEKNMEEPGIMLGRLYMPSYQLLLNLSLLPVSQSIFAVGQY